jgi:hypothetical protein
MMLDKLIEPVLAPLTQRFIGYATGPVLLFWLAGAGLWLVSDDRRGRCASTDSAPPWCRVAPGATRIAFVAVVLATLLVVGAVVATHVSRQLLGLLAAAPWAWWPVTRWVSEPMVRASTARRSRLIDRMAAAPDDREAAAIWQRARHYPSGPLMPTWIANSLAATQQRIHNRYGLDLALVWGVLIELIPEPTQRRLESRAASMSTRCQSLVWAVVAVAWIFLLPNTALRLLWISGCAAITAWCYAGLRQSVSMFGDLVEDVVSIYRIALYDAFGVARPTDTATETEDGEWINAYLNHSNTAGRPLTWHRNS